MKKLTSADCQKCGACCVALSDHGSYCDVTEADEKKLSPGFVKKHVIRLPLIDQLMYGPGVPPGAIRTSYKTQKTGLHKGYELNTCDALRGSVMSRVSCSVYKNRPRVCHTAVKPGDKYCLILRKTFETRSEDLENSDD